MHGSCRARIVGTHWSRHTRGHLTLFLHRRLLVSLYLHLALLLRSRRSLGHAVDLDARARHTDACLLQEHGRRLVLSSDRFLRALHLLMAPFSSRLHAVDFLGAQLIVADGFHAHIFYVHLVRLLGQLLALAQLRRDGGARSTVSKLALRRSTHASGDGLTLLA